MPRHARSRRNDGSNEYVDRDLATNRCEDVIVGAAFVATLMKGLAWSICVSAVVALALLLKSFKDFSQTGPQMRQQIHDHYRGYVVWSTARLILWAFILSTGMAALGVLVAASGALVLDLPFSPIAALIAAGLGIVLVTGVQFCRHLLYLPASIAASYHYRKSRLYPLWGCLTPARLRWATGALVRCRSGPPSGGGCATCCRE